MAKRYMMVVFCAATTRHHRPRFPAEPGALRAVSGPGFALLTHPWWGSWWGKPALAVLVLLALLAACAPVPIADLPDPERAALDATGLAWEDAGYPACHAIDLAGVRYLDLPPTMGETVWQEGERQTIVVSEAHRGTVTALKLIAHGAIHIAASKCLGMRGGDPGHCDSRFWLMPGAGCAPWPKDHDTEGTVEWRALATITGVEYDTVPRHQGVAK